MEVTHNSWPNTDRNSKLAKMGRWLHLSRLATSLQHPLRVEIRREPSPSFTKKSMGGRLKLTEPQNQGRGLFFSTRVLWRLPCPAPDNVFVTFLCVWLCFGRIIHSSINSFKAEAAYVPIFYYHKMLLSE